MLAGDSVPCTASFHFKLDEAYVDDACLLDEVLRRLGADEVCTMFLQYEYVVFSGNVLQLFFERTSLSMKQIILSSPASCTDLSQLKASYSGNSME